MNPLSLLKRFFKNAIRVGIWTLTAVSLFACILFGRIFFAPLDLGFAREIVIEQTANFLPGWDVSYETAVIGWDYRSVRPWVFIENLQLVDRRDRLQATISKARIDLALSNFFSPKGIVSITVDNPIVNVSDLAGFSDATDDGDFGAFFDWDGPLRPEVFKPVTEAFSRFALRLLTNAPSIENVSFKNAYVNIARGLNVPKLELTWPIVRLQHNDGVLNLYAQVDALISDQLTHVRLTGLADPEAGNLSITLAFNELSLAAITKGVKLPEFFEYLNLPLGLDLSLDLSADQGLRGAVFGLNIGEGYLYHPIAYPNRAPVSYGTITGGLNVAEQRLSIDTIDLQIGPNNISGTGNIFWQDDSKNAGIKMSLTATPLSIAEVKKYWPIRVHPDGRRKGARVWVDQNMIDGFAENVKFDVTLNPDGTTPYLNSSLFELTFDLRDVNTRYIRTMAPLENVAGRAVLTNTAMDIYVNSGTAMGMPVGGSVAHMSDINIKGKGVGVFDIRLEGDMRTVLELINPKPINIGKRIKMDLDRLSGKAKIEAKISLP